MHAHRFLALALVATACTGIRGSGTERAEDRPVTPFSRIEVGGAATLAVTVQAGATPTASVRTDDNLQAHVRLDNAGATLRIVTEGNLQPSKAVLVTLRTDRLDALTVSGAAKATVAGLHGDAFTAKVSGAGDVQLAGAVRRVTLDTSGAASVQAAGLKARELAVTLSGAGSIGAFASEAATVDVSGAGRVVLDGKPGKVEKKVSGVGSVEVR